MTATAPTDDTQAALVAALALADAEPTARNRELARLAARRHHIAAVECIEVEQGIRPRRRVDAQP